MWLCICALLSVCSATGGGNVVTHSTTLNFDRNLKVFAAIFWCANDGAIFFAENV
jgi:hypothetical protein